MFYYKDLHKLVLLDYPSGADEFIALSGYIGPTPIKELKDKPFKSTVIFGLFKESKKKKLHDEIVKINDDRVKIYYPDILSHSKCYVWLKNKNPIKALVGSANFSSQGLNVDYREVLYNVNNQNQINKIWDYVDKIYDSCRICTDIKSEEFQNIKNISLTADKKYGYQYGTAKLELLDRTGNLPPFSGINWGQSVHSHVNPDDAYIPIRKEAISSHPEIFSPRERINFASNIRGNTKEVVELIWDDGETMQVRFEGTQTIMENGIPQVYPKQIASFPSKSILGKYLRKRIGVPSGKLVRKEDLNRYGNNMIEINQLEEGIFNANFPSNLKKII